MRKNLFFLLSLFFIAALAVNALCDVSAEKILLSGKVMFEHNSSELSDEAVRVLKEISALLKLYDKNVVALEGHANSAGEKKYNVKLSHERAKAVADFFVNEGIKPGRIKASGYGDTRPRFPNDTEYGMAQNRRTEILIITLE